MLHEKFETAAESQLTSNRVLVSSFTEKLQVRNQALNHTGSQLVDLEELIESIKFDKENYELKCFKIFDYQSELTATLYKQASELLKLVRQIQADILGNHNILLEVDRCELAILQFAIHCADDDAHTWLQKLKDAEPVREYEQH